MKTAEIDLNSFLANSLFFFCFSWSKNPWNRPFVDMKRFTFYCNVNRTDCGVIVMTPNCVACRSWTHLLSLYHETVLWAATDHCRYEKDIKQSIKKQQAAKKKLSGFPPQKNGAAPEGLIISHAGVLNPHEFCMCERGLKSRTAIL